MASVLDLVIVSVVVATCSETRDPVVLSATDDIVVSCWVVVEGVLVSVETAGET